MRKGRIDMAEVETTLLVLSEMGKRVFWEANLREHMMARALLKSLPEEERKPLRINSHATSSFTF
jgi:hypothetical protein